MSFNTYQNIAEVVQEFAITYLEKNYLIPIPFTLNDYLRSELQFNLQEVVIKQSEYSVCETLIYPILREVWKDYKNDLMLWSHPTLKYSEQLSGIPDYVVAKRSPLGKIVFDQPYLVAIEAKKDNFTAGWGQVLAELIAIQKLNKEEQKKIFGIVTNGERWEFGQLQKQQFTKNIQGYNIEDLDSIFAAVNAVFTECQQQL